MPDPNVAHFASGYPNIRALGALAGAGGGRTYVDQSITIRVDGSGVVDPQAVASAVTGALGRNSRTRGTTNAVRL